MTGRRRSTPERPEPRRRPGSGPAGPDGSCAPAWPHSRPRFGLPGSCAPIEGTETLGGCRMLSAASGRIERVFSSETTCACAACGRRYLYDRRKGHTRAVCNSCRTNARKSRRDLKAALTALRGGSCEICGYSGCLRALGFHHLDPATKRFHIAGSHTRSWESILAELEKCVLLCANCHVEVEVGMTEIPKSVRMRVESALQHVEKRARRRPGRPATA
jgi:hypothetical protein